MQILTTDILIIYLYGNLIICQDILLTIFLFCNLFMSLCCFPTSFLSLVYSLVSFDLKRCLVVLKKHNFKATICVRL